MSARVAMLTIACVGAMTVAPVAQAQRLLDRDTPADVQKGSANAVVEIDKWIARITANRAALIQRKAPATTIAPLDAQLVALGEAKAAMSRVARDVTLAGRVLDEARKTNFTGIVTLLKPDVPQSELTIDAIKDWTATFSFKVRGVRVRVCGSSEGGCSSGSSASVLVG